MNEKFKRENFLIYKTYYDLTKCLSIHDLGIFLKILFEYYFENKQITEIDLNKYKYSKKLKSIILGILPQLKNNNIRYEKIKFKKIEEERRLQERRENEERRENKRIENEQKNLTLTNNFTNLKKEEILEKIHEICKDDSDGHSDSFYLQQINKLGIDRILGELKEIILNNNINPNEKGKILTNRLRSLKNV
jgi:uncharacterized protein YdaU (DUF1376 family)